MNKKIWRGLVILVLLVLGIWLYAIGLKLSKVSEEKEAAKPELFQKKEIERAITPIERRTKVRKPAHLPKRKVSIPPDYEPVSPEVKGIENFAEEREREAQRKDRGIPTG